jgi:transposase, IS6 family
MAVPGHRPRGLHDRLHADRPLRQQGRLALPRRGLEAARHWPPFSITGDKNPAHGEAIRQLKRRGQLLPELEHRQVEYLNDRLEADHGSIERLCRATLGFKSMKTACATIKGFEALRMVRKRQCICLEPGVTGEVRFVAKLFAVYA